MMPDYYQTGPGTDLYDLWRQHYGQGQAARHLEMAALEYLWRCRFKGQYRHDLEKVRIIVERLLAWAEEVQA